MRRAAPWLILAIAAIGVLVWATVGGDAPTDASRARRLAAELRCMECQGLSLADANTETARAARADIEARIAAGESDDEIRAAYVATYGEAVLLRPEGGGLGTIVWAGPLVILLVGGAGIVLALRRNAATRPVTPEDRELVAAARAAANEPEPGEDRT